jgi:hypothetical protein
LKSAAKPPQEQMKSGAPSSIEMRGGKPAEKQAQSILTPQDRHPSQDPRKPNTSQSQQDQSIDPKQIPIQLDENSQGESDEEPQQIQNDFEDASSQEEESQEQQ